MPDGLIFDLYDEQWRDCWVAATSVVRLRKKQVDLDIQQRVMRLLEDYGPDSEQPLTLRIYGTMIKGFCVINNERARALFVDCERVVLAFARQPFAEGDSKLKLPAAKRPKMEAALTLNLDLARVEASEAFDWTQAPLEEGALLRLLGGEGGPAESPGAAGAEGASQLQPLLPDAGVEAITGTLAPPPGASDGGWLPSGPDGPAPAAVVILDALPEVQAEVGHGAEAPAAEAPAAAGPEQAPMQLVPLEGEVPPQPPDAASAVGPAAEGQGGVAAAVPAVGGAEAVLAVQLPRRQPRREPLQKPGVVYGFDEETTLSAKDYELWQQDCSDFTMPRVRAPAYADAMASEAGHAEHLAPSLRLLVDPSSDALPQVRGPLPRALCGRDGRETLFGAAAAEVAANVVSAAAEVPAAPAAAAAVDADGAVAAAAMATVLDPQATQALALALPPEPEQLQEGAALAVPGGPAGGAEAQDDRTAEVGGIIRGCLRSSGLGSAAFHELVPPGFADRGTAACTFSALLALASAGELRVVQGEPYGPIIISEATC